MNDVGKRKTLEINVKRWQTYRKKFEKKFQRDLLVDFWGCVELSSIWKTQFTSSRNYVPFGIWSCKRFVNFSVKMFSKNSKIFYLFSKFLSFPYFWRFRETMKFSKVLILPKTCINDTQMCLSFTNVNKSNLFHRFSKFLAVFISKKFEIEKNGRV